MSKMNYTKGERKHTSPDANGGVNVFTDTEHIAYFDSLDDALLDIAAPDLYEACKEAERIIDACLKKGTFLPNLNRAVVKALAKAEEK